MTGMRTPTRRLLKVADSEFVAVSEGRIRIMIGVAFFAAAMALAVLRLANVSLFTEVADRFKFAQHEAPSRANLVDRNGELMATTLPTYALYARPRYIWGVEKTADALTEALPELDYEVVVERLSKKGDQILIKRGLTPKERQAVFAQGVGGLIFQVEPQRVYPRGQLASHILGFTDPDMIGLAGAERAFHERLSADNAPDLALSVDLRVQQVLTEELQKGLEHFKADTNAGIVLNIKTGEIVAMASLPNYDPNVPGNFSPQSRYSHASVSTYELGSVFKPITMAMALEDKITDLNETFPVQNPLKVRDKFIRDDHPSPVPMAMPKILAKSSNRGTALIAMRAGGDRQQEFLKSLGLMDRVPFELKESAHPQVQREWQDITTVTVSYGHGISVTPLALTVAMGAILNDGMYVTPTILKRDPANRPEIRRVVSKETSETVRDLMRYTTTNGTGRNARVKGYGVMGKTGTADKPSGDGYDERRLVSSFISAFPYEDPTYAVFITYDEPKGLKSTYGYATAGWNAAPTVGKVIERIAPMLGVPQRLEPVAYSPFSNTGALQ